MSMEGDHTVHKYCNHINDHSSCYFHMHDTKECNWIKGDDNPTKAITLKFKKTNYDYVPVE